MKRLSAVNAFLKFASSLRPGLLALLSIASLLWGCATAPLYGNYDPSDLADTTTQTEARAYRSQYNTSKSTHKSENKTSSERKKSLQALQRPYPGTNLLLPLADPIATRRTKRYSNAKAAVSKKTKLLSLQRPYPDTNLLLPLPAPLPVRD